MVKVNVTNNESVEDNKKNGSMEEMATEPDKLESGKEDEKEPPLEEMSKTELLEKIKEVSESADKNLIKQLLTVVDNLEKAVIYSEDENSFAALKEGIELTLKGLSDTLKKSGVEEIKASGELFDPNIHEAVFQEEDNTKKPGTIIQEIQKGYLLNKRLIRPSLVSVSKSKD